MINNFKTSLLFQIRLKKTDLPVKHYSLLLFSDMQDPPFLPEKKSDGTLQYWLLKKQQLLLNTSYNKIMELKKCSSNRTNYSLKLYYIKTSIPSKKFHSDPTSIFILFGNGNLKNHIKVTRPVPIIHNLLTLKESQNRSVLLLILFDRGRREFLTLHS